MTLFATFFGYLFGLPMGILLMVTDKEGIRPHSKGAQRAYDIIYKILDVVVNIARSIPFLILLILVIPITKAIVGKKLWFDCNHRSADDRGSTVYRTNGGVFLKGSRPRGYRGGTVDGG